MKTGKITAKLRDAVPVCLMVEGNEVMRYKNIELPDALKEVEMTDFHFNVHMDGKITFDIHYEQGVLPEVFPEPRGRVTRAEKAAAKAARATAEEAPAQEQPESAEAPEMPEEAPTAEDSAAKIEAAPEAEEAAEEAAAEATEADEASRSSNMEVCYNVTGPRRKELATAVGDIIGMTPVYQKAPTYAFTIGEYTIDRNGTLIGAENKALTDALAEQGFTAA